MKANLQSNTSVHAMRDPIPQSGSAPQILSSRNLGKAHLGVFDAALRRLLPRPVAPKSTGANVRVARMGRQNAPQVYGTINRILLRRLLKRLRYAVQPGIAIPAGKAGKSSQTHREPVAISSAESKSNAGGNQ